MTRTAAIMQPTYLPYLGYLHLIAAADVFVFLDDVQFARRSWQQRNRIWGAGGEVMLSVPVQKADRDTPIDQIEIADTEPWRERHLGSIRHTYAKRPFFADGMAFLDDHLRAPTRTLADLNIALIAAAARKLEMTPELVRASTLDAPGERSDHLLAICRAVGATDYLSPTGSQDYMADDGVFAAAGFPVRFQGFVEIAYPQGHGPFAPYMAFIDAVMNLGWTGTRDLIEAMRGESGVP
ncbi:WbqC family protein [Phenylobacterium sp.]|uniref:WbqC family protein n=1 Tax=Phenylobacterium sp. TaxID=1871053 RepID=UPI00286E9A74|nr:WbqC family protein [Phenylobacterium sp.]